jgi:hypothetical protein
LELKHHDIPVQHAVEHAESAILAAQGAHHDLQSALTKADPELIQSANGRLQQAKHELEEAYKHAMDLYTDPHHKQQLQQTVDQLRQSKQEMESAVDKSFMPKQVR